MENKLLELITYCKEFLDKESISEVMHFFNHDEYEMALEGLVIEMIKANKYPKNFSIDKITELLIHYHLNIESVFDCNFWKNYTEWILKY